MKKYYISIIFFIIFGVTLGYIVINQDNLPLNANKLFTIKVMEDNRSLVNLPLYLALSKGFFTEENLKVILTTAIKGEEPLEIIQDGNHSDIYLCGPEEIIYLYQINKSSNLKYFYNLSSREGSYLISKVSLPNFTLDMMKKKTIIGAPRGTLREMILEKYLHNNNLTPQRSLNIIQTLTAPDKIIAYLSGSGDFIQVTEPDASLIITKGKGFRTVNLADRIQPLLNKGFIASHEYIEEHPIKLQDFTNAMYKAQLWIEYRPIADYVNLIKRYYPNHTTAELTKGIQNYKKSLVWSEAPTPTEKEFDMLQEVMDSAGELRNQLKPELFLEKKFTLKTLEKIKKEDIISSEN